MSKPVTCDIFCAVVDNYGDIGVCWRLARQLAHERGIAVRLWVDDLASFSRLCPEADASLVQQVCKGVEVRCWTDEIFRPLPQPLSRKRERPGKGEYVDGEYSTITPADLVIEAFACELPQSYIAAMAAQEQQPVWINLEYLSAEGWVAGCHKLPSPHPSLPLIKYFFFPGVTPQTGGLLLEHDLLARRDAFQQDEQAISDYWRSLDVTPQFGELRVSLFGYENPAVADLLAAWAEGTVPVLCLVPEGRILPQVAGFFGKAQVQPGQLFCRGKLRVMVLPFVEQERYDRLLWACDVNFVRGEDSFVRALWAARPFVWQIYPQHDAAHLEKLGAFMQMYCAGLSPASAQALRTLWEGWNGGVATALAWNNFHASRSMLRQHAQAWALERSNNSLALNLLDFFREVVRMRAFKV